MTSPVLRKAYRINSYQVRYCLLIKLHFCTITGVVIGVIITGVVIVVIIIGVVIGVIIIGVVINAFGVLLWRGTSEGVNLMYLYSTPLGRLSPSPSCVSW